MTAITASDMRDATEADRHRVLTWVRKQGLEPDHVYSIRTFGPLVRARVFVLSVRGNKQLHPRLLNRPWMRTRWLRRRSRLADL